MVNFPCSPIHFLEENVARIQCVSFADSLMISKKGCKHAVVDVK